MSVLAYDLPSYRNMLRMSSLKRILVEGRSDKILFKLLLSEMFGRTPIVHVDSAEDINFGYPIGNRAKVEAICNSVQGTKFGERVVGFVDREFREFDLQKGVLDLIGKHKVIGRVIWSRGHSLENYYFDFAILRRPLRTFSVTPYFDEALDEFEAFFDSVISIACAAGLAGNENGLLNPIKGSINWHVLKITSEGLMIDLQEWRKSLIKHRLTKDIVDKIIEDYEKWLMITRTADTQAVRHACHGHIGLAVIWSAYAKFVHKVCSAAGNPRAENEAHNVLKAEESVRFNACAEVWVQEVCRGSYEYPIEIFQLLNIDIASSEQ